MINALILLVLVQNNFDVLMNVKCYYVTRSDVLQYSQTVRYNTFNNTVEMVLYLQIYFNSILILNILINRVMKFVVLFVLINE